MATKGKAYARRTAGNVYDVTYERSKALDASVGAGYLAGLVRSGYEVVCDNNGYDAARWEVGRLVGGEVVWTPEPR